MPASPSHTVCKAENEHPEAVVPTRAMERFKGTRIAVRVLTCQYHSNITVLPARALTRAVGATPTAAQLWQQAGRAWQEVWEKKGHREDGEGSLEQQ